jgi:choline-sulfatase
LAAAEFLAALRRIVCFAIASALVPAAFCAANPPVILISIDTLRADRLGAYGYRKASTPHIDSFAQNGTVFTAVNAQIPLTLPSHTVLFTSTYPFENRVEENGERVPAGLTTLASILRDHGYKTAAFIGSCLLNREMGLDRGFDVYDSPFHIESGAAENPYSVRVRRDGALVIRAARQWLDANRAQPVFAFLHLFDLHTPYAAPAAAGRSGSAAYDAELGYIDQLMGRLRDSLEQGGWWDRSLVILLSDHGEGLGDHGESSHGYFIYQSTVHVPLIVHWPSGAGEHAPRVTEPAGLIDVAPTVLDFLHIAAPAAFHGVSLLHPAAHAVYSESLYAHDAFQWAALRALRDGSRKYIQAPYAELYELSADPGEMNNLYRSGSAEARPLETALAKLLSQFAPKRAASAPDILPQMRATLGSLGYLSGGTPGIGAGGPDPKDRLPEFQLYEKGLAALYGGHFEAAVTVFRDLLARDPHNTLARYYLGDAFLRSAKPDDAIREWTAALAFDPEYAPADEAIGAVWLARGDYAKARGFFEQALAVAPNDFAAELELGLIAEREGNPKEAVRRIEAACKVAPESLECGRPLQELREKAK